jgi:hypothetical protein
VEVVVVVLDALPVLADLDHRPELLLHRWLLIVVV